MSAVVPRGMTEADADAVIGAASRRTYAEGEYLVMHGDEASSVHLLASGHVAVQVNTHEGATATLAVLGPGEMFGEVGATHGPGRRSASVVALEPVTSMVIDSARFHAIRMERPTLDRYLLSMEMARSRRLTTHLLEALHVTVDQRIIRRLVSVAETYGGLDAGTVIPLSQQMLASMAGSSRPTVNQVLRELEEQGTVALGRSAITILDPQLLRELCEPA